MMLWVYVSSLVMICQRAAEILACFRFGGFAVEYHWLVKDISARNNVLAIRGGLIISPDVNNKFEMYSCEERGVKTHRH